MSNTREPTIDERIAKLPRWAQEHIDRLDARVKLLTREHEVANGKPTRIRYGFSGQPTLPHGFVPEEQVHFLVGGGLHGGEECEFTVKICEGNSGQAPYLRVTTMETISVVPSASNSIHIRKGDY